MSDWERSDSEAVPLSNAPAKAAKFADEDASDVESEWDASSADEAKKPTKAVAAAPTKKKGGLKARIAEKEAARQKLLESEGMEEGDALDWAEKRRILRQMEIDEDMSSAADLLSVKESVSVQGLIEPKTADDFSTFSKQLTALVSKYQARPLYAMFMAEHIHALASTLTSELDIKSTASKLTALGNERTRLAKEALKKGSKKTAKPGLGTLGNNTAAYREALDDSYGGGDDDDFM